MQVGSCFAGIGGMDLGLESTGQFRTVWTSEINRAARRVLEHRFPHALHNGDIHTLLAGESPGRIDVLIGGPPCQDISKANAAGRQGLAGVRSGLFHVYMDIITALRPRWLIMEQVLGLQTSGIEKGADYATVLAAFDNAGYETAVVAHNSLAYVPQSRARLYFVASDRAGLAARALLPVRSDGATDPDAYYPTGWKRTRGTVGSLVFRKSRRARSVSDYETWTDSDYVNTLTVFDSGRTRATTLIADGYGVRCMTPREWERCCGFPDDWTIKAGSDSARYACLGNAVTPPVIARIGSGIIEVERQAA